MSTPAATAICPCSLADLFWRFTAPLNYIGLCFAAIAGIYASSECLSQREALRLAQLQRLEVVAAEAVHADLADAELQVKLIQERDKVMAAHRSATPFLLAELMFVAAGLVAGVLRVATIPRPESAAEWWLVSVMLLSLAGQVVTALFAGACGIALA
jgi:hypothetical protein